MFGVILVPIASRRPIRFGGFRFIGNSPIHCGGAVGDIWYNLCAAGFHGALAEWLRREFRMRMQVRPDSSYGFRAQVRVLQASLFVY
jgi:hypothetical protein